MKILTYEGQEVSVHEGRSARLDRLRRDDAMDAQLRVVGAQLVVFCIY